MTMHELSPFILIALAGQTQPLPPGMLAQDGLNPDPIVRKALGLELTCIADLDFDCAVEISDVAIILRDWGPCESCPADLDSDGIVNAFDLAMLLGNWGACGPPPAPTLDEHPNLVSSPSITITGSANYATLVQVSSVLGPLAEAQVEHGGFTAEVPLAPHAKNQLFFSSVNSCSQSSAPATTFVTHDGEAPSIFIDFPSDGAEIQADEVDVAGRVGDRLSGFEGLAVSLSVNGKPYERVIYVNVGIGNNGTFFAPGVRLSDRGPTVIEAVATDVIGNASPPKQITVMKTLIDPSAPRMEIVSGNGQQAQVHTVLPAPIQIRMTHADGSAFIGKVVTFEVTKSDGRLGLGGDGNTSGSMLFQTHTDDQGIAEAFWRLGGDAGFGNNRVEVRSSGIEGTVAFCASATAGPASQINIGSGNGQRAETGGPAPEPLRVWVSDACNGVAGIDVTFSVIRGDGTLSGETAAIATTGTTGHAEVPFTLGQIPGNNVVRADFSRNTTNPAEFVVFGVQRSEAEEATFSGIVVDNASSPIQGAICTLEIEGQTLDQTETDVNGMFSFFEIPSFGPGHLMVDGTTAFHIGGPGCDEKCPEENPDCCEVAPGTYPKLAYNILVTPNAENSIGRPILLPRLNPKNVYPYSTTEDTVLTVDGVEGIEMLVKAGSMSIDGKPARDGTPLYLNQVHHDDIPMPMPDGAAPPFAWTLQPAGAHFDPPVQITYPNMSGLPAGAIAYFLSFDHDTNQFGIVASGHVTPDRASIQSDAGSGITTAGWGCNCPPYSVTGDCCGGNTLSLGPGSNACCNPACSACEDCINGQCISNCPSGAICCNGSCCTPDHCCEGNTRCCPPSQECIADSCCDEPCNNNSVCCQPDTTCEGPVGADKCCREINQLLASDTWALAGLGGCLCHPTIDDISPPAACYDPNYPCSGLPDGCCAQSNMAWSRCVQEPTYGCWYRIAYHDWCDLPTDPLIQTCPACGPSPCPSNAGDLCNIQVWCSGAGTYICSFLTVTDGPFASQAACGGPIPALP